jgi:hypothetical protein
MPKIVCFFFGQKAKKDGYDTIIDGKIIIAWKVAALF